MSDSDAGAGGPQLVRVDEKLDVVASKAFEAELLAKLEAAASVLYVDFSGCPYVSSAGLRAVLIAAKTARKADKRVVLVGMNPIVREVFKVSGFDRMLTIEPDLATAREQHG
jgi:anti-sigma B factor antagonist